MKIDIWPGELHHFESASSREWLVTNGIGGFACGTVSGAVTRRYHGLLVAALRPPTDRAVMVSKVDVVATYRGQRMALGANEFADGTIAPRGYMLLDGFRLEGSRPVWRYVIGDAEIEQSIWMAPGENTTYLRLTVNRSSAPVLLELSPLCTHRDYHHQNRGASAMQCTERCDGFEIRANEHAGYRVTGDHAEFKAAPEWYWGFRHRVETARGLDDIEDLFRPGVLTATLAESQSITLTISTETKALPADAALDRLTRRNQTILAGISPDAPDWIRQLALAADQFIVDRSDGPTSGKTVIAGYPWFADWGRDTMIALPGLTLATGRQDVAADVLRTFGRHVVQGMLPNRFPDSGSEPEYNTADATLWYFHAIDQYFRQSGDLELPAELFATLEDIIQWHVDGTRYGIRTDTDGLLHAGEPGWQLTWMDAKVGDWVITPRLGKPVEINALWYRALIVMQFLASKLGHKAAASRYEGMSARIAAVFQRRFWNPSLGHLYDVVDGADGIPACGTRVDPSMRPNQVIALAVAPSLLEANVARAVVDACAQRLWTPMGLRSLAPDEPAYVGCYGGGPRDRDAAYHQGTVWSWLLGPFALAHFNAYGDSAAARRFLRGIEGHLREGCIGNVSEISDGDPPHQPAGCFAQAWSVAEIFRAWVEIGGGPLKNLHMRGNAT
ncbi:MAG: amylo-alpha-1,6-glucosidase [Gammaproteobacteria bacterium]